MKIEREQTPEADEDAHEEDPLLGAPILRGVGMAGAGAMHAAPD
jgi:hypothetical protein